MEDIAWGTTEDVNNGLDIERLASVIDELAEFHAYQQACPRILASEEMVLAKDHFYKAEARKAVT